MLKYVPRFENQNPIDDVTGLWQSPRISLMSRFFRRLISAIVMWVIALFVIFSGNETIFLLLIGSLGMAGLWEYFQMIEHSGMRCFKAFGMACGAASFIGGRPAWRAKGVPLAAVSPSRNGRGRMICRHQ